MKFIRIDTGSVCSLKSKTVNRAQWFRRPVARLASVACLLVLLAPESPAQTIQFRSGQVRITIPVSSTNSTTITNLVTLSADMASANFNVSGLPGGAAAVLTDTNGNALTT